VMNTKDSEKWSLKDKSVYISGFAGFWRLCNAMEYG
jgi:hypothetical protein